MGFINIPNYSWQAPVQQLSELPTLNNSVGDARIVIAETAVYFWDGDSWELISGGGGGGDAFTIIQTDAGTSPVATGPNDTLTLTSSDNSITITGNAITDTVDLIVAGGGSGDVVGPASSTDESMVVFDGATGKLIKETSPLIGGGINTADATTKVFRVTNDNNSNYGFEVGKAFWTLTSGSRVATFQRGVTTPDYDYVEVSVDSNDLSGFKRRKNFYMGDVNWDYHQALLNNNGFRFSIGTVSGEHRFDSMLRGSSHSRPGDMDYVYNNNGGSDVILGTWEPEGNLLFQQVGKGISIKQGSGTLAGNAVLVGGTVTVTNTNITADSVIMLTRKTAGGSIGDLTYTLSAGASFTINSANASDTSTVSYFIIQSHA